MAKYKLVLTVKDNYGKEKEIDGGAVDIELDQLSEKEIETITNIDALATDNEVDEAIQDLYDDSYLLMGGSAQKRDFEETLKAGQ